MPDKSLRSRTLALIHSRPDSLSLTQIAEATGIDPIWLWNFARGATKDKSVDRVQKIYEHLTGKPLVD